ncbi:MAG: GspH/FimT family pseudopilin [Methylobacillus sp.]|jgi:type IV fimbrial biogenesis protein FimT|nr:GspH/FimT family pseudopilin [Methylobacillus sp.]
MGKESIKRDGFTLVELVVALSVLAILTVLVGSSWRSVLESQRIKSAASALYLDLSLAKSEAVKRNNRVRVTFMTQPDGNWCYGWKMDAQCDCFEQSACAIDGSAHREIREDFPDVALEPHLSAPGDRLNFERTKLFVSSTYGNISLKTEHKEIRVVIARTGRIRLCSPAGITHVAGYSSTC